jgi:hypothetical protein
MRAWKPAASVTGSESGFTAKPQRWSSFSHSQWVSTGTSLASPIA